MKPIINLYVENTPEGNLLKWVGNVKNRSSFVIKRSIDEISFYEIEELNLQKADGKPYEYLDADPPNIETFYMVEYHEGVEIVDTSEVVRIGTPKKFDGKAFGIRVGVAVVLVAFAGFLISRLSSKPEEDLRSTIIVDKQYVNIKQVSYTDHNTTIEALGKVIASQPIDLVSEVSGKIEKGDVVLKKAKSFPAGAVLFRVNQEEALLNLKAQRSNFLNAVALILPDIKLDFPNSFEKWNAYFNSIDIEKALPNLPEQGDQREKTFLASRNIAGQFYTIKSQEERLTKYVIKAPYSGIIQQVYTDAGSVASPGTRVIRVRRTDDLELELPVRKEDIQWVSIGTQVTLESEDRRQTTTGVVNRISREIDPTTQAINVYVSVNSGSLNLYEGMYLYAKITGSTIQKAMEVSRKAVVNDNQVFVVKDSLLQQKNVNVHKMNNETLLFSGLSEGEWIVTEPFLGASNGMRVIPIKQ